MKIRSGFVSNSSSSSFIVFFEKLPKDAHELQKLLFGDEKILSSGYGGDTRFTTEEAAHVIFRDLQEALEDGPLDEEALADALHSFDMEGAPEMPPYDSSVTLRTRRRAWKKYETEMKEFLKKEAKKLRKKYEGHVALEFEYEDHTAMGSALEHGDVFRNVPHVTISKH